MIKLQKLSPWMIYVKEVAAMLDGDPEVHTVYDESTQHLKVFVENEVKAEALDEILKKTIEFGNVTLSVDVIPSNGDTATYTSFMSGFKRFKSRHTFPKTYDNKINNVYANALEGNAALSYIHEINGVWCPNATYIVFVPDVVQYYNDDLGDAHGLCSTLFQDIAKRIFVEKPGVYYCTDKVNRVNSCEE